MTSSSPSAPVAPLPPRPLFRPIKTLRPGTHLVLPRHITTSPCPNLTRLIEYSGASALSLTHIELLSHLRIVKTGNIRAEARVLQDLDLLASVQITGKAESTWLVKYPVFGKTLEDFGHAYRNNRLIGIPNWLLAHIFLGMMTSLSNLHDAGYAHNNIFASSFVLDAYRREGDVVYRYREYPLVRLAEFGGCAEIDDDGEMDDVQALLEVMQRCVLEFSDNADFIGPATYDGRISTDDPILLVLRDVTRLLAQSAPPTLDDVRDALFDRLIDTRHTGPMYMSPTLRGLLHEDLVTNAELMKAVSEPVVLRSGARHEEFVKIVAGEETGMGVEGFAGMRTGSVLVVRFRGRRGEFARLVGGDGDADAEGDADDDEGGVDGLEVDAEGESE